MGWTIWWDTQRRPGTGRWNTAAAPTEAGAVERALHFLKLGFFVHAIRNPDGSVFMDEAQINAHGGTPIGPWR